MGNTISIMQDMWCEMYKKINYISYFSFLGSILRSLERRLVEAKSSKRHVYVLRRYHKGKLLSVFLSQIVIHVRMLKFAKAS